MRRKERIALIGYGAVAQAVLRNETPPTTDPGLDNGTVADPPELGARTRTTR